MNTAANTAYNNRLLTEQVDNALMARLLDVRDRLAHEPLAPTKGAVNLADAFVRMDPALASLDKQRRDMRAQLTRARQLAGNDDMMLEILKDNLDSVEEAYLARLDALRASKEETDRANALLAANENKLDRTREEEDAAKRHAALLEEKNRLMAWQERLHSARAKNNTMSATMLFAIGYALGLWSVRGPGYAMAAFTPFTAARQPS